MSKVDGSFGVICFVLTASLALSTNLGFPVTPPMVTELAKVMFSLCSFVAESINFTNGTQFERQADEFPSTNS